MTASGYCECGCGQRTTVAPRTDRKWGAVKGQPRRFVSGHHLRASGPLYLEEDRGHDTPCWIWQRSLNEHGYGRYSGRHLAHRAIYEQQVGPIPDGLDLDHLCRVRACVNPDHLEPVTRAENLRRGREAAHA